MFFSPFFLLVPQNVSLVKSSFFFFCCAYFFSDLSISLSFKLFFPPTKKADNSIHLFFFLLWFVARRCLAACVCDQKKTHTYSLECAYKLKSDVLRKVHVFFFLASRTPLLFFLSNPYHWVSVIVSFFFDHFFRNPWLSRFVLTFSFLCYAGSSR